MANLPNSSMANPTQLPPSSFKLPHGSGQAIKFSPFSGHRLACAAGSDYGLSGLGYVYVLERDETSGQLSEVLRIDYKDSFLDVCWSEADPNILTGSTGDGFVQLWNLTNKFPRVPIHEWKGHKNKEMSSIEWCPAKFGNTLLASSWDGTVSTYDQTTQWPLKKMAVSDLIVYQSVWSPHTPNNYISVSQDGMFQMWDLNASNDKSQIYFNVSESELLTCDWAKYDPSLVVTAGSDCTIRGWDLRSYTHPLFQIDDHGHAIKRVKFSPFCPTILASTGYDMTLRIFDYHVSDINIEILNIHSEFIYGLDWNLHVRNEVATCGFDKTVKLNVPNCLLNY